MTLRQRFEGYRPRRVWLLTASACSRDHIEAINLANEGDQSVKVNIEGRFRSTSRRSSSIPRITGSSGSSRTPTRRRRTGRRWRRRCRAPRQVAPDFANYCFKRGYALIKMAEAGNPDKYEEAKEPLQKCIEKDPNFAECYHFLGEASLWTDDEQAAHRQLHQGDRARSDDGLLLPAARASSYITLKFYEDAEKRAQGGHAHHSAGREEQEPPVRRCTCCCFEVAQATGDKPSMVVAMEKAKDVAGDAHPEISFNLGSTYAVMDPPQKDKAVRLLSSFVKRACRSAKPRSSRNSARPATRSFRSWAERSTDLARASTGRWPWVVHPVGRATQ